MRFKKKMHWTDLIRLGSKSGFIIIYSLAWLTVDSVVFFMPLKLTQLHFKMFTDLSSYTVILQSLLFTIIIYYTYKCIVSKLIVLRILQNCKDTVIIFICFAKYIPYRNFFGQMMKIFNGIYILVSYFLVVWTVPFKIWQKLVWVPFNVVIYQYILKLN
jgi:hypothetical protein